MTVALCLLGALAEPLRAETWALDLGARVTSPTAIASTRDGGLALAGFEFIRGSPVGFLAKFTSDGDQLWLGTSTGAGGFLMLGTDASETMVARLDESGIEQERWRYQPSGMKVWGWGGSIALTPNGGFLLRGRVVGVPYQPHAYLLEADANGAMQWSRVFGEESDAIAATSPAVPLTDGGFAMIEAKAPRIDGGGGVDLSANDILDVDDLYADGVPGRISP